MEGSSDTIKLVVLLLAAENFHERIARNEANASTNAGSCKIKSSWLDSSLHKSDLLAVAPSLSELIESGLAIFVAELLIRRRCIVVEAPHAVVIHHNIRHLLNAVPVVFRVVAREALLGHIDRLGIVITPIE